MLLGLRLRDILKTLIEPRCRGRLSPRTEGPKPRPLSAVELRTERQKIRNSNLSHLCWICLLLLLLLFLLRPHLPSFNALYNPMPAPGPKRGHLCRIILILHKQCRVSINTKYFQCCYFCQWWRNHVRSWETRETVLHLPCIEMMKTKTKTCLRPLACHPSSAAIVFGCFSNKYSATD